MRGLEFKDQPAPAPAAPNRMDVALFVGFVRARSGVTLPAALARWLAERGWTTPPYARPVDTLLDVPLPVESAGQFDALFEPERVPGGADGGTYLGAAVRSFFAQGGRSCYVVRAGDPWRLEAPRDERLKALARAIPGYPLGFAASPADRASWTGAGHVFGLPEVSFLCVPDLADACAADRVRVPVPPPPPPPPEAFVECSEAAPTPPEPTTVRDVGPPVVDEAGWNRWATAIDILSNTLARRQREVTLVAAVPLPEGRLAFDAAPATAFVQLAYPWVRTPGSGSLPGRLESPDGVLAGVLARGAMTRGAYRSVAGTGLGDVYDVWPDLDRAEQVRDRLVERVCLAGPTPNGLRLLSDVTMSTDEVYRPGPVSRLVSTIVRAARRLGEEVVFDVSGERLWGEVRLRLERLMRALFDLGAFRGATPADAYAVRCDRSTMTQNDLDNGRVVAYVQFEAAAPVETITVALVLGDGAPVASVQGEAA